MYDRRWQTFEKLCLVPFGIVSVSAPRPGTSDALIERERERGGREKKRKRERETERERAGERERGPERERERWRERERAVSERV